MRVFEVKDNEEKSRITLEIMQALPEWFSPPEDIRRKAVIHREFPFFAAEEAGRPVGFATLKIHNQWTADIYTIGVLQEFHRHGVGHLLVESCIEWCRKHGYVYLTVKTLDESAHYAPYDGTRAFYQREGFLPLEVFTNFWDEENPCLFLVKDLRL
ncbi:MAG: GNAT family N-acetyltransferase [Oscillospiraceae bacterium]|nr:GNAT family N-acetyltransferase [Oscillospiraceae bacterium]